MNKSRLTYAFNLIPGCLLAIGLTACGSPAEKPNAPSPTLSIDAIKSYTISWSKVADVTYYKLLENADGSSGFTQVGGNISSSATSYEHIVPLYNRLNAQYILEACNSEGCSSSSTIAVSPTATQLKDAIGYVKASNTEEDDGFGSAVSISGDGQTLAVSAVYEDSNATGIDGSQSNNDASRSGAVYVFTRSGANWSQQAYIKASDSAVDDAFGTSISLNSDGSTLAVGAPDEDTAAADAGSVYVFTRSGTTWTQQDSFQADDATASIKFGSVVSLSDSGSTVAVGATTTNGAAYIFTRTNNSWSQKQKLTADNAEADDQFGLALSLSGDGTALVIGAEGEDSDGTDGSNNNESSSGAAYVFVANASGTWSQQAYIKANNAEEYDGFGRSLSLNQDGSTLVVGSYKEDGDDTASEENTGAAYVFTRTGTTWTQQAYLKASNAGQYDQFGDTMSISNDGSVLAIGTYKEQSNATGISTNATGEGNDSLSNAGAVYMFTRSGTTWSQIAYIKASNTEENDIFSRSISLSGDGSALAIGASGESSNGSGVDGDQTDNSAEGSGAVYLY